LRAAASSASLKVAGVVDGVVEAEQRVEQLDGGAGVVARHRQAHDHVA
jgi:hypothetical protein